jgi:phospholipase C
MMNPTSIEHVVVLMLENRSFDHMLGRLPGVNGILDAKAHVKPDLFNFAKPGDTSSTKYPAGSPASFAVPTADISKEGFGGPGHSFPDATVQLQANAATAKAVSSPAPLDGFIANYLRELEFSAHRLHPTDEEIREPMTTFTPIRFL